MRSHLGMVSSLHSQCDLVAFVPSRLLPCDGLFEVPLEKSPPGFELVAACHPSAVSDPLLSRVLGRVRPRFSTAGECSAAARSGAVLRARPAR